MSSKRYEFKGEEIALPLIASGGFHHFNHTVKLPLHRHCEGPEITFVLKGAAVWQTEDGRSFRQPGGTFAVMPRDQPHRGAGEVIAPCRLFWFVLNQQKTTSELELNTPFSSAELTDLQAVFAARREPAVATLPPPAISQSQRIVGLLKNSAGPLATAELRLGLCGLLLEVGKILLEPDLTRPVAISLLLTADHYIRQHLKEKIRVGDLAAACRLSESQFNRRFYQETGGTPADYLMRVRIEEACRQLTETNMDITGIAFRLGFPSSQYLATVFRRYLGCSPREFRRKHQNQPQ